MYLKDAKISLPIIVLIVRSCFDQTHGLNKLFFALVARAWLMFNYERPSRIFPCILLTGNHMIFLVQFGTSTCLFFQRPQLARARRARVILLVFEKIYSCLFNPNCTRNHVITYTNIIRYRYINDDFFPQYISFKRRSRSFLLNRGGDSEISICC